MPTKMTSERALIVLNQCNTDGRIKVDLAELKEAVKVAVKAIRRGIPRKPDLKPEPLRNEVFWWQCPNCKANTHANTMHRYCYHCGQALDWSD